MLNCEFVFDQMVLMLPPALENKAAEASATNASMSVYSIRSWPRSSVQNCVQNVVIFVCLSDEGLRVEFRSDSA